MWETSTHPHKLRVGFQVVEVALNAQTLQRDVTGLVGFGLLQVHLCTQTSSSVNVIIVIIGIFLLLSFLLLLLVIIVIVMGVVVVIIVIIIII